MISESILDFYQTAKSPIHTLDPRVKIIATVTLILSNVLLPDGEWALFGISWGVVIILNLISRVKLSYVLKRSLIAIPFALMAFAVIFSVPGEPLAEWSFLNQSFVISTEGIIKFLSILIRAWCSVQATILLTATTTFPDIAHGLRHLRLPLILLAILSFMYRYLSVLIVEAQRLLQARAARSAIRPGSKKPSLFWNAKNAGNMIGQLFLRSYERSDRVYEAMVARGFKGQFLTYNPHHMQNRDWIALLIFTLVIIMIHSISIFL